VVRLPFSPPSLLSQEREHGGRSQETTLTYSHLAPLLPSRDAALALAMIVTYVSAFNATVRPHSLSETAFFPPLFVY
jgi:hypothetical protein